jgi:hypothetical protein
MDLFFSLFGLIQEVATATPPAMIPGSHSDVQGWVQAGASAGFCGLAWYLIVYGLPDIQQKFDETVKRQLDTFERNLKDIRETYQEEMQNTCQIYEKHIERLLNERK